MLSLLCSGVCEMLRPPVLRCVCDALPSCAQVSMLWSPSVLTCLCEMLSLLCSGVCEMLCPPVLRCVCDALSCAQVLLCEAHISLPALVSGLYSLASRLFHEWFSTALKSCRIGVGREGEDHGHVWMGSTLTM